MSEELDSDPLPLASARAAFRGASCRTCRGSVIWVTTANGKRLAVDVRPTADGTVELIASVGSLVAVLHGGPPPDGHARYRVHRAACSPRVRGWRARQAAR